MVLFCSSVVAFYPGTRRDDRDVIFPRGKVLLWRIIDGYKSKFFQKCFYRRGLLRRRTVTGVGGAATLRAVTGVGGAAAAGLAAIAIAGTRPGSGHGR